MSIARPQRRLSAVLMADIVGYSRLVGVDEEGIVQRWQAHQAEVVGPHIDEFGGRVVKSLGDGLLVEFASAVDAVRSAAAIQQAISKAEDGIDPSCRILLRIGINVGDVIVDGTDIQGDGVNLGARLQAVAPAGGVLVSQGVRDAAAGKADLVFVDRGEMRFKNISRPVRVFALDSAASVASRPAPKVLHAALSWRLWAAGAAAVLVIASGAWVVTTDISAPKNQTLSEVMATPEQPSAEAHPPLSDRASIAVLPFGNLSGDSQQDYFSDGISEDLIAALARFSSLLVIARSTTFQYKGKAVDIATIGRELNVRYFLEGSVRRAGDRVRVTAQLIDTETGAHLWADQFDREAKEIFTVQDQITEQIVGMLASEVSRAELARARRKPPTSLVAYDYYLQASDVFWRRFTVRERGKVVLETRKLLELAIAQDPEFALAYVLLAATYVDAWVGRPNFAPLNHEHRNQENLVKALALAQKAVSIDPRLAEGHAQMGWVLHWLRRGSEAQTAYLRAFAINPNLHDTSYAAVLIKSGDFAGGLAYAERMLRVDPASGRQDGFLGHAQYMMGRYAEAAVSLKNCQRLAEGWIACHIWRAAALAQLGLLAEARAEAAEVRKRDSDFTIKRFFDFEPYSNSADAQHLADGLRKAGLPE